MSDSVKLTDLEPYIWHALVRQLPAKCNGLSQAIHIQTNIENDLE